MLVHRNENRKIKRRIRKTRKLLHRYIRSSYSFYPYILSRREKKTYFSRSPFPWKCHFKNVAGWRCCSHNLFFRLSTYIVCLVASTSSIILWIEIQECILCILALTIRTTGSHQKWGMFVFMCQKVQDFCPHWKIHMYCL
jgi:hypothetical protein